MAGSKKIKLLYIMSPSYSGSTLLTFMVAKHPDISTIGELKATSMGDIDEYTCSCGDRIKRCGFWNELSIDIESKGGEFDFNNFGTHFRSGSYLCDRILRAGVRNSLFEMVRKSGFNIFRKCEKIHDEILTKNLLVMESVLKIQGGNIFLDASKDPLRAMYFSESEYIDMKVIMLIRDGRGVTNSYIRHNNVDMEVAAKEWKKKSREMLRVYNHLGQDVCMKLNYEDFCRAPGKALEDIYIFAGLGPVEKQVSEYHILGNAMRLSSNEEIKIDEKWRKSLTKDDIRIFDNLAGELNRSFGYR